ncbi:UMP kinase [Candidatus Gottesmanbacteria bacterium]|nr:UMP kinase [Candidatus Gottesmanbacteria bacterium]
MDKSKPVIISLGGSLVVPNGGIDSTFLSAFSEFIRIKITLGWRFFIVVGGGATARMYIEGARAIVGSITDWDLDWLGIHTTRLNAHLIRTIFQDVAHPRIIENYEKKIEDLKEPLVVASGWKPGRSTDYDAIILARDYGAGAIINMSNIVSVCDKDPNRYPDAKPVHQLTWEKFQELIGTEWHPGSNVPFDPIATKLAHELGLSVFIVGSDLENLELIFSGKSDFVGTIITPE